MSTQSFVSMEQALALLIKLDLSLVEYGVMDILQALIDEAELNYDQVIDDPEKAIYALTVNVCHSRYRMAEYLQEQLQLEFVTPNGPLKTQKTDEKIDISSLSYWAAVNYGIDIPVERKDQTDPKQKRTWQDLTISICQDFMIRCVCGSDKPQTSNFRKIELMGSRKSLPNKPGLILIGLSEGEKFPPLQKMPTPADKKAMSLLRNALRQLSGLQGDPFYTYNHGDGWKPRFKLRDRRSSQDERAKQRAIHVPFDETGHGTVSDDFEREDDSTQEWLDKEGYR